MYVAQLEKCYSMHKALGSLEMVVILKSQVVDRGSALFPFYLYMFIPWVLNCVYITTLLHACFCCLDPPFSVNPPK